MDSTSLEEINKVRQSMGMKLLPVPGANHAQDDSSSGSEDEEDAPSTLESREAQGYENFKKLREEQEAKKKREQRAAEIKKARDRAQRDTKLQGKGIAEQDDADLADTKSWLKNQKKRQAKIETSRKLEEKQAAVKAKKAAEAAANYPAGDVKVGHDVSSFLGGDEQILTLKDAGVLDEEAEDELEALALREEEKLQENLRLKKKKPIYDPNDDTEQNILAQYDEVIDGKEKKNKSFSLSALASASATDDLSDILAGPAHKRKQDTVDLDQLDDAPAAASDYMEVSVKKPKKKKSKSTRRRVVDDDDVLLSTEPGTLDTNPEMDVDSGPIVFKRKQKVVTEDLEDDDDLQASLKLQRKAALKKRKPEEVIREGDELAKEEEKENQQVGLVMDEITGFVDLIGERDRDVRPKKAREKSEKPTPAAESGDEDEEMADAALVEEESVEGADTVTATGVEEEKTVSQGMGATLELLRKRKLISEQSGADLNAKFRQQQLFQAELKRQMAIFDEEAKKQRELDRQSGRLDRMSSREKEAHQRQQNSARDQHQARILQRLYNEGYTPNVELKYISDDGRSMSQKEAWRHLSHKFHGKQSGAGKTEKMMKKIEAEKRREAESILDVSQNVGISSVAHQQIKKRKEAGVRLA